MAHATRTEIKEPGLAKRFFTSVWFRMLVFAAALVVAMVIITGGADTRIADNQTDFLANAVRRSAVQCYALEGRFPDNLSYLEDNYGLIIDHYNYAVYYEPMGGNLIPQIRVLPLQR